jgi:hypothetical protein
VATLPEAQLGPAERLLDLVLNSSAHLWHNRPGLDVGGVWAPRKSVGRRARAAHGVPVPPGLFVPAAQVLYAKLLDLYLLNATLMAHFAGYVLEKTEWRDLKVACAALMLVQPRAGQPIHEPDGSVALYEDDYRAIGEAMMLRYEKQSTRMLTPRGILRIAELLETPGIAELNRVAGFADPASTGAPLGRWPKAAARWLAIREGNPAMLHGLVKAGYKSTLKQIARKVGYKPSSKTFFELLGWKQKQAEAGHREVGLVELDVKKKRGFGALSEAEICEVVAVERLSYKETIGRLPKGPSRLAVRRRSAPSPERSRPPEKKHPATFTRLARRRSARRALSCSTCAISVADGQVVISRSGFSTSGRRSWPSSILSR